MSRIGKKPITIPKGVTVKVLDDNAVEVKGPKGQLRQAFPAGISFEIADGTLVAKRASEEAQFRKFHGLSRSLVANAVVGVTDGFKRELDIVGVGYRAEVKGKQVVFALGYSHAVVFDIPAGIDIDGRGGVAISFGTDDHDSWIGVTDLDAILRVLAPVERSRDDIYTEQVRTT